MKYIGYQRLWTASVSFSFAFMITSFSDPRLVKSKPVPQEEEDEEEELRKLQAEMAM